MKNKTHLMQMELLVMTVVFALAAAVCLRVFVFAQTLSATGEARDRGLLAAQTAAETLKALEGDGEELSRRLGGSWDGAAWQRRDEEVLLTACPQPSPQEGMALWRVQALTPAGEELLCLECAWQEVTPND